jgi:hypothetical protein
MGVELARILSGAGMKVLEVNRPNRAARRLKGGGLKDRCHLLQALALATGLEHRFTEPGLSQGQSGLRRSPGHR